MLRCFFIFQVLRYQNISIDINELEFETYIYGIFFDKLSLSIMLRVGSRTAATSKMEGFVIIVNGWKQTDAVAAVLDPTLMLSNWSSDFF